MKLLNRANGALTWRVSSKRVPSRLGSPVASFTFDDFPRSAWTAGGPILERYDAAATYYVAGRLCGGTENGLECYDTTDLKAVHSAGHEIGCHTYAHRHMPNVSSRELKADFVRNQTFIREVLGDVVLSSFAYPFGAASLRTKALASSHFSSCRGIRSGVNGSFIDLGQLRVVRLESRVWTADEVETRVEEARRTNGWIIFLTHDVADDPSPFGATPPMLEHALAAVRSAGIEILPVKHALARVAFGR